MSNLPRETVGLLCTQATLQNRTTVNWLAGVGVFLLVLGILLQIAMGSWTYVGVWVCGIVLLIIAGIVYACGDADRACANNPDPTKYDARCLQPQNYYRPF